MCTPRICSAILVSARALASARAQSRATRRFRRDGGTDVNHSWKPPKSVARSWAKSLAARRRQRQNALIREQGAEPVAPRLAAVHWWRRLPGSARRWFGRPPPRI